MKRLFAVLPLLLLTACSHLPFLPVTDIHSAETEKTSTEESLKGGCDYYAYDNSETACNLLGWQAFVQQSLSQSQEAHNAALLALGSEQGDKFKRMILLSNNYEVLDVRMRATKTMLAVSQQNLNGFGSFFYIIATFQNNEIQSQDKAIKLQAELKKMTQENAKLGARLTETEAKIQAIMDIEKNLKTN